MRTSRPLADRSDLAWALGSPFPDDEAAEAAARGILAGAEPERVIDALIRTLLDQKSICFALDHLDRAGGDLTDLQVSTVTVADHPPLKYRSLWPVPPGPTWALADLRRKLQTHNDHLWRATTRLQQVMPDEAVTVLSGRAMESLFPDYEGRLGFDVDLWFGDVETGLEALELLTTRLGFGLRYASLDDPFGSPSISSAATTTSDGYEINVGVITGPIFAGRFHRERRRYRGAYAEDLVPRSQSVERNGASLRTPSPEDLLLMVAARVRRRNQVQLVNIADVAVILRNTDPLDVELVSALAERYGLTVELGVLLSGVGERWPELVHAQLTPVVASAPALHRRITRASVRGSGAVLPRRMERWALELSDIHTAQGRSWPRAGGMWAWNEMKTQSLAAKASIAGRSGKAEPPVKGAPLCVAAAPAATSSVPGCVAVERGRAWAANVSNDVETIATRLVRLLEPDQHECRRFWATGLSSSRPRVAG